jgi:hypothetical protein
LRKKKPEGWETDIQNFYHEVNQKVFEIQFTPRENLFDPSNYRLVFRKILEGFDPHSDAFLLTDYVFKDLYRLRESLSQELDVNPETLCDVPLLYLLSRLRPLTEEAAHKMIEE